MNAFGIFRISKKVHKVLGLVLMLFIVWMSLSGIMMNHPEIIAGITIPKSLVPEHYWLENWNRGAIADMLFSKDNPQAAFVGGKEGVWRSTDGGIKFKPFMHGDFSSEAYYRKTNSIYLKENKNSSYLFAGTYKGLYFYDLKKGSGWNRIRLSKNYEPVVRILEKDGKILAFSDSYLYQLDGSLKAEKVDLARYEKKPQMSMIQLFFDVHDGKAWGLPGKLLFDLAGLAMIFLCVTGFYMWYFPKRARAFTVTKSKQKFQQLKQLFKTSNKWHLKFGASFALLFLIIGGTGFFMRPPTLVLIDKTVSTALYPGFLSENRWDRKIRNAEYDSAGNKFIIDATDGYWTTPADLKKPFKKATSPIPIFPMGATVLKAYPEGLMIGSFNGLYFCDRRSGKIEDVVEGGTVSKIDNMMPGKHMITGYFLTPEGDRYATTHNIGLVRIGESKQRGRFSMPEKMADYNMPFWNYLFEIHNGRFFKGITGGFYIIIVPLGAAGFVLLTLTGIYDWLYKKLRKKKAIKKKETQKLQEVRV